MMLCVAVAAWQDAATPGPSCTTSPEGTCSIDLNAAKAAQQKNAKNAGSPAFQPAFESATLTAVITAEGHGPLVVPQVPNSGRYRTSNDNKEYVASIVLDRKLVKPGDELHVTGEGAGLAARGASAVGQDGSSLVMVC